LTHSQLGALSTRSVHPWTVDRMNRLINGIGGNVEVVNPLLAYWPMRRPSFGGSRRQSKPESSRPPLLKRSTRGRLAH
jgi:hypothetical protein